MATKRASECKMTYLKTLCRDIRAIFSKLVSHDITTPTRLKSHTEFSIWQWTSTCSGYGYVTCDTKLLKMGVPKIALSWLCYHDTMPLTQYGGGLLLGNLECYIELNSTRYVILCYIWVV